MKDKNIFYSNGYGICLKNAKSLFKISNLAGKNKEYGIACSLNILAAEEAIKAIVVLSQTISSTIIEPKEFSKVFSDHKTKHKLIKQAVGRIEFAKISSRELLLPIIERNDDITVEEIRRIRSKGFKRISKWVNKLKNHPENSPLLKEIDWWGKANDLKNEGFYVGQKNGKWLDPSLANKERFKVERKYANKIITYTEMAKDGIINPLFQEILSQMNFTEF